MVNRRGFPGSRPMPSAGRTFLAAFGFYTRNGASQPGLDCVLEFHLTALPFHAVDGFALLVQGDVVAGNVFLLTIVGDKVVQQALAARVRAFGVVEIDTGERVLKNGRRLPGGPHRPAVAALLEKTKFEPEYVEDVAFVRGHDAPPPGRGNGWSPPVLVLIVGGDLHRGGDRTHRGQ